MPKILNLKKINFFFIKLIFFHKTDWLSLVLLYMWVTYELIETSFSAKKEDLCFGDFCHYKSHCKLKTRCPRPISFQKFWNFVKTFSWYRHMICHHEGPINPQFNILVQATAQKNKFIIVIPWAVKAVTVGKAPPFLRAHYTGVGWMFTMPSDRDNVCAEKFRFHDTSKSIKSVQLTHC